MAERIHLFPYRTQKLSSLAPKVLSGRLLGRIGHRHISFNASVFPVRCFYIYAVFILRAMATWLFGYDFTRAHWRARCFYAVSGSSVYLIRWFYAFFRFIDLPGALFFMSRVMVLKIIENGKWINECVCFILRASSGNTKRGFGQCLGSIRSQFDADTRHIENNREWQMNKRMRVFYWSKQIFYCVG